MAIGKQRRRSCYSIDVVYDVTGNGVTINGEGAFVNMNEVMMECDEVGNRYRV